MHVENKVSKISWGEIAFGAFLLAIFVVWIWDAPYSTPAASRLPLLLAGTGVCLVAILAGQEMRRWTRGQPQSGEHALHPGRIVWCIFLTLAYVILLRTPYFGFLSSTIAFVMAQSVALGAPRTGRDVSIVVGLAILIAAGVYVGFGVLLEVPLPSGKILP